MALTVTILDTTVFGNKRVVFASVDFDSSYHAGGESLQASDVGLKAIDFLQATPKSGYLFEYDYTNQKLKAMYPTKSQSSNLAATVTITNATGDGDAGTYDVNFTGEKGAVDAGPAEEVADGTDLSSLTGVRVMIIGG